MIEEALESIERNIEAQIRVLATSRGIINNSAGLNELIEAKNNLISMKVKPSNGLITCEHCGEANTKAMHGRWHGDKCKMKK